MSGDYGCGATLAEGLVVCFSNQVGGGYCYLKEVGTGFSGYTFNCEDNYCPFSGFDVGQDQTACCLAADQQTCYPLQFCISVSNTCCGTNEVGCTSTQTCFSGSSTCCDNACGGVCLDGTGSTCCGDTAVCSAGQQCVENICTFVSSSQPSISSQVNSLTNQVSTPFSTPSQVANPSTTVVISLTTLSTQLSNPSSTNALSLTTLSTQLSKTSSNTLSQPNNHVPTSVQTDPAAACFLSTQFSCYYTTPTWYESLPNDAQSLYSATNTAASDSAFCTSTAVINPKCLNGTHNSGLPPGAKVGVGLGSAAGAIALIALILYLLKACLSTSSKAPLAFKPFIPPPPPPTSIPPSAPGEPHAPPPHANPVQPNVPHQSSHPPYSGSPNTPRVPNGPVPTNRTGPISSIPPASHSFTSTTTPIPPIIGGLRRRDDRNDRIRAETILRKAVPSRLQPDRLGQGINEAGGDPVSEMSEVAGGVIRHEVPEGTRRYEAPDQQVYEAPDQQVYEAPGYGSGWRTR